MQGCLTKLRILFHCLLDGGQFKMSQTLDTMTICVAALIHFLEPFFSQNRNGRESHFRAFPP